MICSRKTRTENQNETKFRSHHCSVMVPIQMKHMCQIGSSAQKHKSLTPTTCQTANWFLLHQHVWSYLSCYPTCLSTKTTKNLYRIILGMFLSIQQAPARLDHGGLSPKRYLLDGTLDVRGSEVQSKIGFHRTWGSPSKRCGHSPED